MAGKKTDASQDRTRFRIRGPDQANSWRAWIETLSHLATALSIIIAVLVYWNMIDSDKSNKRNAVLYQWKQRIVYSIISKCNSITFEDIKAKYLREAQQERSIDIEKSDISDETLRNILFLLTMTNMIGPNPDGTYSLRYVNPQLPIVLQKLHESHLAFSEIQDKIINFLITENHKYTIEGVFKKLREVDSSIEDKVYYSAVSSLIGSGYVFVDKKGHLYSNIRNR